MELWIPHARGQPGTGHIRGKGKGNRERRIKEPDSQIPALNTLLSTQPFKNQEVNPNHSSQERRDRAVNIVSILDPTWAFHSSKARGNPSGNCFHEDLYTALETNATILP